ncbi:MAG: prepilin-type N-terminal cleavage/methylation domain-containing protein [candidate division Zixibacteria bacterium]|nr:prepilin-type N-terminal cleavage/methylation domain-containing protein [candidate division Zixibacteria bacterium]
MTVIVTEMTMKRRENDKKETEMTDSNMARNIHMAFPCKMRFFNSPSSQRGMTLIELVMVIIIIAITAGVAMKAITPSITAGKVEASKKEMGIIADAILAYTRDVGAAPANLTGLTTNPGSYTTWKGPYLRNGFDQDTSDFHRDAWNTLYTYVAADSGVCLTSTGSGTNVTKRIAGAHTDLDSNTVRGTVLDIEDTPPGLIYRDSVTITITYPNKTGSDTTRNTTPTASGTYSFNGIPIGTHTITAIHSSTHDTVTSYLTVNQKLTLTTSNFKFGKALWRVANALSGNGLVLVNGSAKAYGTCSGAINDSVQFEIYNGTGKPDTLTSLTATYNGDAAYYKYIYWGTTVCDSTAPLDSSGVAIAFSSSKILNNDTKVTIYLKKFGTHPWLYSSCAMHAANMSGRTFTITFSDGSVITFTT